VSGLKWETPKLKSGYPHECYRACSGDREYWLRSLNGAGSSTGWRLLVFDAQDYVGATNHRSLQHAKWAAEQWESQPTL
jgi:hypothetical protein